MRHGDNLIGMRFGSLIVQRVEKDPQTKYHKRCWCLCDCGSEKWIKAVSLVNGTTQSCGCRWRKYNDLTGYTFGRLTVISRHPSPIDSNTRASVWRCLCECGKETVVRGSSLRDGTTRSCGCLQRDAIREWRSHRWGVASFRNLYGRYRDGAKRHGREWALSEEEARKLFEATCIYCGREPWRPNKTSPNGDYIYNGIDRVNNLEGYTASNSVTCCTDCNLAKRDKSLDDFLSWVCLVATHKLGMKSVNASVGGML